MAREFPACPFERYADDVVVHCRTKAQAGFVPAASKDAIKNMSEKVKSWRLHTLTGHTMDQIAHAVNPVIRGWMQYYGAFYKTELYPLLYRISGYLVRWIRKKYRRLRTFAKPHEAWKRVTLQHPALFAHWQWIHGFW